MEPRQLLSTFVVTNTNDDTNPNSLRWAILQANSSQAASEIQFGIARSGSVKIQLSSPLPALDVPVSIDGTTEPGYVGSPLVEIDGVGLSGGGDDGLVIMAGGSTIRGLSLVGFSGSAIVLNTGSEDAIADNYLGIDPTGAVAIPNQQGITLLGSSGNTIGAGPAGIGNVISGNSGDGILIETGDTGSVANLIDGNRIGTTADGSSALGNHGAGIAIAGADDNIIGAVGPGFGNVIGGNAGPGISVTGGAAGTAIQNNFLGVAADGATPLGNQGDGIQLDDAPGTLIGGASPGEGNIISENQQNGIDTAGDTAGLWVAGNEIGTDLTGQLKLGNYQSGINLASSSNLIGGTVAGAANVIEFNGTGRVGAGVQLVGLVGQNTILSNSIYQNAGLGINFGSGPTPNHAPDTAGPNDYQNYPTLSSAQSDGSVTTVTGTSVREPRLILPHPVLLQPETGPLRLRPGKGPDRLDVRPDRRPGDRDLHGGPLARHAVGGLRLGDGDRRVRGYIGVLGQPRDPGPGQPLVDRHGDARPGPRRGDIDLYADGRQSGRGRCRRRDPERPATRRRLAGLGEHQPGVYRAADGRGVGHRRPGHHPGGLHGHGDHPGPDGGRHDRDDRQQGDGLQPGDRRQLRRVHNNLGHGRDERRCGRHPRRGPVARAGGRRPDLHDDREQQRAGRRLARGGRPTPGRGPVVRLGQFRHGPGVLRGRTGRRLSGGPAPGAQALVTVVLQATAAGSVTETATVTSQSFDADPSNNVSSVTTTVAPACDLAVTVSVDNDVAAVGMPLDYTVTVTNNGPSDATGVVLNDTLPAGVTFVSDSTDQDATPAVSNGVVSLALDTLAAGDSATW